MKIVRVLSVLLLLGLAFIFSNSHILDTAIVGIIIAIILKQIGLLGSNKDIDYESEDDFIDTDTNGDSDDKQDGNSSFQCKYLLEVIFLKVDK